MASYDIALIIMVFGVLGWIPIWFFFNGIVKVIRAFKGLDDYGYNRNKTTSSREDNKVNQP